nr:unnamed protein product [Spirometra erinaceieuropaei]
MDLVDASGSTGPLGPHQPSSLRPSLPGPLRRQLNLTLLPNYHFHPPPPPSFSSCSSSSSSFSSSSFSSSCIASTTAA